MGIFESLLAIDDALIDWILAASPDNEEQTAQMKQVLGARSDVEKALNTLVAYRMKLTAAALAQDAAKLREIADGIAKVDRKISAATSILGFAGEAVAISTDIIKAVVTFV